MNRLISIILGLLLTGICSAVELTMPAIFNDHMVVQQGQEVPVWGTSDAGATVEVSFAGQTNSVKVNANGRWQVVLSPLKASAVSKTMTISALLNGDSAAVEITDVLVGEVWFAGGQSNMYRPFRMLIGKAKEPKYEPLVEYLRKEEANANDTLLRQFRVGKDCSVLKEKYLGKGTWSKAVKGPVHEFCGTAYFFARELRRELNVPVAIIACNLGGTKVEPWIPMHSYQINETLKSFYKNEIDSYQQALANWDEEKVNKEFEQEMANWKLKAQEAKQKGENEPRKPPKPEHPDRNKQTASTLYNGMIHTVVPFAIKGAIWYQGESNGNNLPEQYAMRLSAMVNGWRKAWDQEKLYFYYCQLANYKDPNADPLEEVDGWVTVQDQMRRAMEIPNSGMAVLNDIGEAKDIHPKNKMDAGKRLSLWALNKAYGKKIVCSGPIYKTSKIKDNKVIITFNHAGSGLMVGKKHLMEPTVAVNEPLKRFQICGLDRKWKWAQAKIIGKNKVEVSHPEILYPAEVRYAWSSNPEGVNLYNKEGLPSSLFTTVK
ncbi:sialate O-acetylesterase [Saccharicrinis sp. GN24d3]|uniref:sialate O-acetylesterase n=1 Tax=Saccharicrinis sp. GN24d3 TaxID=3458416 RepID=UPI0040374B50